MAKVTVSHRIEESLIEWIDEVADGFGVRKSTVVEDALVLARQALSAADANVGAMWRELENRYGEDAELVFWPSIDDEGQSKVNVRVNGAEVDDIHGFISVDEEHGRAHVTLVVEGSGGFQARGSTPIGSVLLTTNPLHASRDFPWPPDPVQSVAARARIGDVVHGGARRPETDELLAPVEA